MICDIYTAVPVAPILLTSQPCDLILRGFTKWRDALRLQGIRCGGQDKHLRVFPIPALLCLFVKPHLIKPTLGGSDNGMYALTWHKTPWHIDAPPFQEASDGTTRPSPPRRQRGATGLLAKKALLLLMGFACP